MKWSKTGKQVFAYVVRKEKKFHNLRGHLSSEKLPKRLELALDGTWAICYRANWV